MTRLQKQSYQTEIAIDGIGEFSVSGNDTYLKNNKKDD